MNLKIAAALFLLPLGVASLLPRSASAIESSILSSASNALSSPVVVAQIKYGAPPNPREQQRWNNRRDGNNRQDRWDDRWDDRRDRWDDRWDNRRDRWDDRWDNRRDRWDSRRDRWDDYRQEGRRVWVPGRWEPGFLGIGRRWVEGHWEYRR